MTSDRVASLVTWLRDQGERVTTARRALLIALDQAEDHRSADELAETVRRDHPEIHRATIYRNLETLRRLEVVQHTHLGHGPAMYHLADEVHQHLVCEECGAITEVPSSVLRGLADDLERDFGFRLNARHFAVVGRCRNCGPTEPSGNASGTIHPE